MKPTKLFILSLLFTAFIFFWSGTTQAANSKNSSFPLSPQKLEKFQNEELPAEQKDSRTIRTLYRNVNFIDLRGIEATTVMNSG